MDKIKIYESESLLVMKISSMENLCRLVKETKESLIRRKSEDKQLFFSWMYI